jgi:formate dehydrogenase gamma subunit
VSNNKRSLSPKVSLAFLTPAHSNETVGSDHSEFQPDVTIDAINTEAQVGQAVATLREAIHYHDHRGYVLDDRAVSGGDYDRRMRALRELEERYPNIQSPDSPTQRTGGRPAKASRIVERPAQTLIPRSIYEEAQLIHFDDTCRQELGRSNVNYVAEPTCEGLGVALIYQDGRLVQACTLDEGRIGEDITANLKTIREVPLVLRNQTQWPVPARLVVHGKVYITKLDLKALNERVGHLSAGQKFFANPRDAVIGSLRQPDPKVTASSPLRVFIHDVIGAQKNDFDTRWEVLQALLAWGFKINLERVQLCSGAAGAINYYKTVAGVRETLPYEIKGVVYKVDRLSDGETLGLHEGVPRWAMEYKFPTSHNTAGVKSHERIKRFQKQEIIYHWVQGLPFLFLLMSGSLILLSKFNQLDPGIVNSLRLFHKVTATMWVVGLVITFFFVGFKFHLVNLRQMLTWTKDDLRWMYLSALVMFDSKIKVPDAGKFNPGQKMNMLLVIGYFFGFLMSGVLMWFRGTILISWYFHVALFFAALGSLGGHLYLSFIHPSTRIGLGGIFHGWVPRRYVEHHHALTLKLDQGIKSPDKSVLIAEITKEH